MTRMNWGHVRSQAAMRRYGYDNPGRPRPVGGEKARRLLAKISGKPKQKPPTRIILVSCKVCFHIARLTVARGANPQRFKCTKCGGTGHVVRKKKQSLADYLATHG